MISDKFCFLPSSARIDPKDLADSTTVKDSDVLSEKLSETLDFEALKKAGLDDSSPLEAYKDISPDVGSNKPAIQSKKAKVDPSSIPTPSMEKEIVEDEVMVTGFHKGDPPAKTSLVKIVDSKKQVMSRPYESISENTSIEELYKRSLACSTEQHDIVLQLQRRYEVFLSILTLADL